MSTSIWWTTQGSATVAGVKSIPARERAIAADTPTPSSLVKGLLACAVIAAAAVIVNRFVPTISALLVAIVAGAVVGNVRPVPSAWRPGIAVASKTLLRAGIVLLGLQVPIASLLGLGWPTLLLVVCVVTLGVGGTVLIGRLLGVPPRMTALIACGCSICGAAAVAAARETVGADDEETASALALVVVFGTIAIPVTPALAHLLGLSSHAAGVWVGGSVHEVAQVVAAAAIVGGDAMTVAVVVKLARVVLLAAVMAALGIAMRRSDEPHTGGRRPPLVPGFVLGFLAMVVVGSVVSVPAGLAAAVKLVQTFCLAMAMAALGTGIVVGRLRGIGARPVVLGVIASLIVSAVALTGTLLIG